MGGSGTRGHPGALADRQRSAAEPGLSGAAGPGGQPDQKVVLLCRSGVRSVAAATAGAQAGFTNLWNIVGGFEGRLDEKRQRNHVEGWRFSGLPWEQS